MKKSGSGDSKYQLPKNLTDFQREMYIHLVEWKWKHLTREAGDYHEKKYDVFLPEDYEDKYPTIYPPAVGTFVRHQERYGVKAHKFLGHLASSQAACANLFIPLLSYPEKAALALQNVKPDLAAIALDVEGFEYGYRLEYWGEADPQNTNTKGLLNDHTRAAGTDADIAIAYRNRAGELNLWLIEHKLTENEFTRCGGARSKGNKLKHLCDSVSGIVDDTRRCYYTYANQYRYWEITLENPGVFPMKNLQAHTTCPFKDGLNQLWRNQLLGLAIENSGGENLPFKRVYFSVVRHPRNKALDKSIKDYQELIGLNERFSSFTSDILIRKAKELDFEPWREWIAWYEELYALEPG